MSTRSVPFFNYPYVFTSHEEDFIAIFQDVGRRGAFIMQSDLLDFEQHLAEYTGAKCGLGVSNATDGLHIALRAAGIGPGEEVIFCSHTMVATAAAIHYAGATPIPAECARNRGIYVRIWFEGLFTHAECKEPAPYPPVVTYPFIYD